MYALSGQGRGCSSLVESYIFGDFFAMLKFQLNIGQVLFAASAAKLGISLNPILPPSLVYFPEKVEN